MSYSVEVISTPEGLLNLRKAWDHLARRAEHPNVFTSFEWAWVWWQQFGTKDLLGRNLRLHILHLQQQGRTAALVPLLLRTASWGGLSLEKLEFLGTGLADYGDLLLEDSSAEEVEALLDYLWRERKSWDLVELGQLPADSSPAKRLAEALPRSPLHYRLRADEPCVYIPLTTDWAGFLKTRSKLTRETFHKKANRLKRLEAEGLRIRILENPQGEPGLLARMVALEKKKQVRGAPVLRVLNTAEDFFRLLFDTLGPAGQLYLALMEQHDRLMAYELGFRYGGKLWAYTKAFDRDDAYYSPGTMLIPAVIDYGFRKGYREYDFLRGDEPYKKRWSPHLRTTVGFEIWKPELRSRLLARIYFSFRLRLYQWLWDRGIWPFQP